MEKELLVSTRRFELNFFYTENEISTSEEVEYKKSLEFLLNSFEQFLDKDLRLGDYKFVLNLNLVTDDRIIEINSEYRNKDKVTDVLSFPMQENLRDGDFDSFMSDIELGDLFICKNVCSAQAIEFKISYMEEFLHLATHGFLHVCGYDHEISEQEEKIMESLEEKILKNVSSLKQASPLK